MNNKSENSKVNVKFRLDQDSLGKVKIPADLLIIAKASIKFLWALFPVT